MGSSVPGGTPTETVLPPLGASYSEELIREQLARNYAFFGDEAMAKVRGGTVVIVGCGGVGSWAAVMLARSYVRILPSPSCMLTFNVSCMLRIAA